VEKCADLLSFPLLTKINKTKNISWNKEWTMFYIESSLTKPANNENRKEKNKAM
jgi:hypothetical protein